VEAKVHFEIITHRKVLKKKKVMKKQKMQKTEMLVTKDVAVVKKGKSCLQLLLLPQHFIKLKALYKQKTML
jgi:hypothetical protein